MNDFKSKMRQEWKPQPIKQQLYQFIGLLVIVADVILGIKFGIIVAMVFAGFFFVISIISLIAQRKPQPKKTEKEIT
ncbi:MAG TPA: hypothetical protein VMR19_00080 [Candidatus Saccharimonadales bacterium]|jgi:MFS superfamily sulfate permease-like transporter|nr:hypothetical protein [Candidatus Saccharimonadales bacterium]